LLFYLLYIIINKKNFISLNKKRGYLLYLFIIIIFYRNEMLFNSILLHSLLVCFAITFLFENLQAVFYNKTGALHSFSYLLCIKVFCIITLFIFCILHIIESLFLLNIIIFIFLLFKDYFYVFYIYYGKFITSKTCCLKGFIIINIITHNFVHYKKFITNNFFYTFKFLFYKNYYYYYLLTLFIYFYINKKKIYRSFLLFTNFITQNFYLFFI
jgi:hypothetical protein